MEEIFHSRPWITDDDIKAVSSVLASGMIGQGDVVRKVEKRLAEWVGLFDGVAVGSGSAAMVLALKGLNVGVGDEVVLPSYVCKSILEAVVTIGATPTLCDVGSNWVLTSETVRRVINNRTQAIVVPHLYGIFADTKSIRSLGIPVIEDCAQALDVSGRHTVFGDVVVFSFHPTKCLTSGEGGMTATSNNEILNRMRICRDGVNNSVYGRLFSPLSDVSASLVMAQLDRYEIAISRRLEIAAAYRKVVEYCCPEAINYSAFENSMYFRYPLRVKGGLEVCQEEFLQFGVHVRRGVDILLHRVMDYNDFLFSESVSHFCNTISLPIYPALSKSQEEQCVEAVAKILPKFTDG